MFIKHCLILLKLLCAYLHSISFPCVGRSSSIFAQRSRARFIFVVAFAGVFGRLFATSFDFDSILNRFRTQIVFAEQTILSDGRTLGYEYGLVCVFDRRCCGLRFDVFDVSIHFQNDAFESRFRVEKGWKTWWFANQLDQSKTKIVVQNIFKSLPKPMKLKRKKLLLSRLLVRLATTVVSMRSKCVGDKFGTYDEVSATFFLFVRFWTHSMRAWATDGRTDGQMIKEKSWMRLSWLQDGWRFVSSGGGVNEFVAKNLDEGHTNAHENEMRNTARKWMH